MKLRILFLLVSFSYLVKMAAQTSMYVVVWAKDGTHMSYSLKEKPTLAFATGELVITTSELNVNFPLTDISLLTYSDEMPTGLAISPFNDKNISIESETLIYYTNRDKDCISIYSTNGMLMLNTKLTQKGEYRIPLAKLSKGIYLVKTVDRSFKIAIK